METEEIQAKIDAYAGAFTAAMKKLDDKDAAIALVQELGKDMRTKEIRSEWRSGLAVKRVTAGSSESSGDGVEATPKQIAYLERLGVDVPAGISKENASALIDEAVIAR